MKLTSFLSIFLACIILSNSDSNREKDLSHPLRNRRQLARSPFAIKSPHVHIVSQIPQGNKPVSAVVNPIPHAKYPFKAVGGNLSLNECGNSQRNSNKTVP